MHRHPARCRFLGVFDTAKTGMAARVHTPGAAFSRRRFRLGNGGRSGAEPITLQLLSVAHRWWWYNRGRDSISGSMNWSPLGFLIVTLHICFADSIGRAVVGCGLWCVSVRLWLRLQLWLRLGWRGCYTRMRFRGNGDRSA